MAGSYKRIVGYNGEFDVKYINSLTDATEVIRDCYYVVAALKQLLREADISSVIRDEVESVDKSS